MPLGAGLEDDDGSALLQERLYDAGCDGVAFPRSGSGVEGYANAFAAPRFSLAVDHEAIEDELQSSSTTNMRSIRF
jgi:O-acetyl-ADP-ribose deacetylase (regulator of RNase III)